MKRIKLFFLPLAALLLFAGCETTDTETRPVSWQRQQAYLKSVRDPRVFGMGIYDTPAGVQIRGGGRLHPRQGGALEMGVEEPWRPVVSATGSFGAEWPVLLDMTSSRTWLEFGVARELRATPVGEREAVLVRLRDDDITACLSVVSSLRLEQLFIENPLLYVRMADGFLGPLARGIEEPGLKGVIGWDLLKKFEQIRLIYSIGQVVLFTSEPYEPNPSLVLATLPLVKYAGACAVRGKVNGNERFILIDPAGDFEVAIDGGTAVDALQVGDLTIDAPVVSASPGGVRVGARLLQKYDLTVCPQAGVVYFESASAVE